MPSAYWMLFRFIPAGAGNTIRDSPAVNGKAVYPRWRGEHALNIPTKRKGDGLSPLARGTLPSYCQIYINNAVYPRWRGEHDVLMDSGNGLSGLSPLARGTQQGKDTHRVIRRFIPAGAGNT